MDAISALFHTIVSFLFSFLQLFIGFLVQILNLILDFARNIVGMVQ